MNRSTYFNYIEEKLTILSTRIKYRGKLNILDLNIHSENFYTLLLNHLFTWELVNLNTLKQNSEAIDLVNDDEKILVQISATATKQKIENALSKEVLATYPGYNFKFVAIAGDVGNLRTTDFDNPYNLVFEPNDDIIDPVSILRHISSMTATQLFTIYEFFREELGTAPDILKFDSNVTDIINILSKENLALENNDGSIELNPFEIERKISFNELIVTSRLIDDFKIFHSRINKLFTAYDISGSNKSYAVLHIFNKLYAETVSTREFSNSDELFLEIIDRVKAIILKSRNYSEISSEELDLCVSILTVDAFIRCKIFENPENYNYATTR